MTKEAASSYSTRRSRRGCPRILRPGSRASSLASISTGTTSPTTTPGSACAARLETRPTLLEEQAVFVRCDSGERALVWEGELIKNKLDWRYAKPERSNHEWNGRYYLLEDKSAPSDGATRADDGPSWLA